MKRSTALRVLKLMPKEFPVDDLLERLVFVEEVEKGLAEVKAGKVVPHSEVMASIRSRWKK